LLRNGLVIRFVEEQPPNGFMPMPKLHPALVPIQPQLRLCKIRKDQTVRGRGLPISGTLEVVYILTGKTKTIQKRIALLFMVTDSYGFVRRIMQISGQFLFPKVVHRSHLPFRSSPTRQARQQMLRWAVGINEGSVFIATLLHWVCRFAQARTSADVRKRFRIIPT
jgi:hypothetical protein